MAKKKSKSVKVKSARGKAVPRRSVTPKNIKPTVKAKAAKPRIQSPRSQPLPGMEQVTNRTLNRICEHISDVRREMNRARGEEKDLMNQAVVVMTDTKTTAYRFSGVELVLVPGDVHLRVRLLKTTANADPETKDDTGSGQDAAVTLEEMTETDGDEAASADLEG